MKRTIVQIIFFIYCIANVYPQYSTIWQLGKTDNSSKEFALAPDGKDRFIISGFGDNKKYFYAGEHTPADFPYIIPGPTATRKTSALCEASLKQISFVKIERHFTMYPLSYISVY